MEAMASGLPCVVSRIRGNVDLVDEEYFDPGDVDSLVKALKAVDMGSGTKNKKKIRKFGMDDVLEKLKVIYDTIGS